MAHRPDIVSTDRAPHPATDRGAVLVHTAFALLALIAFTTFVVDFGVFWLARGQAQNSADAAAMAGAVALTYDTPAVAQAHAQVVTQQNLVYGQPPVANVTTGDGTCPQGLTLQINCVRVDVYRDQTHANALPVFFGGLVGLSQLGVRAMAVAQARPANFTNCLRPWSIVDRWNEGGSPPFNPRTSTYDAYIMPPEPDVYQPPTTASPGTGFANSLDYGLRVAVRIDLSVKPIAQLGPGPGQGWARVIELPAGTYDSNIAGCAGLPMSYAPPGGMACPVPIPFGREAFWATQGCYPWRDRPLSTLLSETRNGVQALYAQDPLAIWDPFLNGGLGGVTGSCCNPSPRIVPVGIMDIGVLLSANPFGFSATMRLANIVGLFVEGMGSVDPVTGVINLRAGPPWTSDDVVVGRLTRLPGTVQPAVPMVDDDAAFLRAVLLVR